MVLILLISFDLEKMSSIHYELPFLSDADYVGRSVDTKSLLDISWCLLEFFYIDMLLVLRDFGVESIGFLGSFHVMETI